MCGAWRPAQLAGSMIVLVAGLTACRASRGQGEFPALARGKIEGSVRGTGGQPLDSVNVSLVIPARLGRQYAIGTPGAVTSGGGRFSLAVEVYTAVDPAHPPDTIEVYVRAAAFPPKYSAPAGQDKITDSVLVVVALGSTKSPAPRTDALITLPVP